MTEENIDVNDDEKVFSKSKTGKQHYQEVIKGIKFIKGMPTATLIAMMRQSGL